MGPALPLGGGAEECPRQIQQSLRQDPEEPGRNPHSAKSRPQASKEVKGGTSSLNLSVAQGMAGGEVDVMRVLGEGGELS